jgi:hypothetical protein
MRRIFHNLMIVQTMKEGEDRYGAPYSNFVECIEEIKTITKQWVGKKAAGRYYALDSMLPKLKIAVDAKDEPAMWECFREASKFQSKLRGKEAIQAGHYVKVIMGLLEAKSWDYAVKEYERIGVLLSKRRGEDQEDKPLSEAQLFRFRHLGSVLEAFCDPETESVWAGTDPAAMETSERLVMAGGIVRRSGDTLMGSALGDVIRPSYS